MQGDVSRRRHVGVWASENWSRKGRKRTLIPMKFGIVMLSMEKIGSRNLKPEYLGAPGLRFSRCGLRVSGLRAVDLSRERVQRVF